MSGPVKQWLFKQLVPRRAHPGVRIPPGLSTFDREVGGRRRRLHLRVDPDGTGLLICDASAALRLQATGVAMAVGLLEGRTSEQVAVAVESAFFGADAARVRSDIGAVAQALDALTEGPAGRYPLRDLAGLAFADRLQVTLPAESPEQMVSVLDGLWADGVPFVTLLDPPEGSADWLVAGVERAEDLGMIAGVRASGRRLRSGGLLDRLLGAGVDAVTVPWTGPDAAAHDRWHGRGDRDAAANALARVVASECCAIAEVALVAETVLSLDETLDSAIALGVGTFSIFAVAGEAAGGLVDAAVDAAEAHALRRAAGAGPLVMLQSSIAASGTAALVTAVREGPLYVGPPGSST